jgi:uncharacterized membrane protein
MRAEIFLLAIAVGACIWALRVLPLGLDMRRISEGGKLARFFAATGVAAIASLFAAGMIPSLTAAPFATVVGCLGVMGAYAASGSTVAATLLGSLIYGIAFSYF